jgi:hypothetical protein
LVLFQINTIIKPVNAPPKWAKCATLSPLKLATPPNISIAANPIIAHLAFIGIGINIMYKGVFGNKYPKATKIPIIAPEAPKAGPMEEAKRVASSTAPEL